MREQIAALRMPNFRRFFFGSFISFFGSGLHMIAASWFVIQITGSSEDVGWIWFCALLSSPILLIYSGALIDRIDRVRLLTWLSLIRGILVLFIPLSMALGFFSLWQIYLLAFINGAGFTISFPTEKALLQEMVETKGLMTANALIEISMQIGVFISAGLSGWIYSYIGLSGVLYVDSVTFFIGAFFFSRITMTSITVESKRGHHYFETLKEGWRFLFREKRLFLFGVLAFIPSVVTLTSNTALPAYVRETLGGESVIYGLVDMSYGIGAFASGFLAVHMARKGRLSISIFLAILSALSLILVPQISVVTGAFLVYLIFGLSNTSLRIILSTMLMERTPKEYMGRVSSACYLNATLLQFISIPLVGQLVDRYSPQYGFSYLAALMIGLAGALFIVARTFFRPSREIA